MEVLETEVETAHVPACCWAPRAAELAHRLYAEHSLGGPPERAGLDQDGQPCPEWHDLSDVVRAKWEAVAKAVLP